jgi:hypothetical protein
VSARRRGRNIIADGCVDGGKGGEGVMGSTDFVASTAAGGEEAFDLSRVTRKSRGLETQISDYSVSSLGASPHPAPTRPITIRIRISMRIPIARQ